MATVDVLLDKVKDIAPTLRSHAAEAEASRRVSRPVVDAMRQAGLYRMARPAAFGGVELDPVSMLRVVEEVARHDSAAGWTLQLSLAVESCLAWLSDADAAEILEGHSEVIFGTSFTPTGGQASPWNEYRFQQYFRDAHTMTQHAFSSASRYESVGALMLGRESDRGVFVF